MLPPILTTLLYSLSSRSILLLSQDGNDKEEKGMLWVSLCIVPIVYHLVSHKMPYHYYPDISFHTLPRHRAFKGENGSVNVSISLYFSYHLSFIVSHKILILYIVIPTYHFTSVEVEWPVVSRMDLQARHRSHWLVLLNTGLYNHSWWRRRSELLYFWKRSVWCLWADEKY